MEHDSEQVGCNAFTGGVVNSTSSAVLLILSYLCIFVPNYSNHCFRTFPIYNRMLKCVSNAYSFLQRASKSHWCSLESDEAVQQPQLFLYHHQWQPCLLKRPGAELPTPSECSAPDCECTTPTGSPPITWSPSTSRSTPRLPCRGRASEPPAMQPRWRSPHLLYWIVRSLFSLLYNPMYKVRKLLRHTSTKNFNLRIIGNAP